MVEPVEPVEQMNPKNSKHDKPFVGPLARPSKTARTRLLAVRNLPESASRLEWPKTQSDEVNLTIPNLQKRVVLKPSAIVVYGIGFATLVKVFEKVPG